MGKVVYKTVWEFRKVLEACDWYAPLGFWDLVQSVPASVEPYEYDKDPRKIFSFLFYSEEGTEHMYVSYKFWDDLVSNMRPLMKEQRFTDLFWVKPDGAVVTYNDSAVNLRIDEKSEVRYKNHTYD